jgi:hypothetical protein
MAKIHEPTMRDKPRKFEHIYKDEDGSESIWKYDLDKFPNGPISVENKYSTEYLKGLKDKMKLAAAEKKYGKLAEMHMALDKVKEKRDKKEVKTTPKTNRNTPNSKFNPNEEVRLSEEPNSSITTSKSTPKNTKKTSDNFW